MVGTCMRASTSYTVSVTATTSCRVSRCGFTTAFLTSRLSRGKCSKNFFSLLITSLDS